MMYTLFQIIGYLLLVIHFLLFCWSVGGIMEMALPKVFWKPFTNPAFPDWLLVVHWGSVLVASVGFIFGYLSHWGKTPWFMTAAYGLMALVCVAETFGYMTNSGKYAAMAAEFAAYLAILFILFRSAYFIDYFSG